MTNANAIEEAREALGAFVDRPWMKCLSDDLSENHLISMDVRVADLRRASRALAALSAPTLSGLTEEERAGLAAIRARHDAALARMADNNWPMSEGRQDIAALLAIVDKMRADQ